MAGCSFSASTGSSWTIDPHWIEGHISSYLAGPDLRLRPDSVSCPEGVKPAEEVTFECTAHIDGVQVPMEVTVTQVDVDTGSSQYSTRPVKPLLVAEKIVALIKANMLDQDPNAKVDCGTERFQVVEVGGAMECTVSAGGERRELRVVAVDQDGKLRLEWAD